MKFKSFRMILTFAVLFTAAFLFLAFHDNPTVKAVKGFSTKHDIEKLGQMNFKLEPAMDEPIVQEDVAIKSASEAFPSAAGDATSVTVEYQLVTQDSYEMISDEAKRKNKKLEQDGRIHQLPAYIVSFHGLHIHPSRGGADRTEHEEFNVVIDAASGEALMGMSYR
ncbi:hypothetical protein B5M42_010730 [Paenibacillus athensensis]|uniref:PepSY domain-containing protein n=1 Tax=Paenibacillus athensensis TaxID=1967502 RepID=A0A4Y8PXN5_9BACL|nr:hypothetical protein [Paenibacillus athensensis]MCD1259310.1 hypothetical protein [Paenibacillus athensensis]